MAHLTVDPPKPTTPRDSYVLLRCCGRRHGRPITYQNEYRPSADGDNARLVARCPTRRAERSWQHPQLLAIEDSRCSRLQVFQQ